MNTFLLASSASSDWILWVGEFCKTSLRLLLIPMLCSQLSPSPQHEVPIAMFNLTINPQQVELDITIDKEDLKSAIRPVQDSAAISHDAIQTYFNAHTQWRFNQGQKDVTIETVTADRDHYLIHARFHIQSDTLKRISIHNTCLVNEIDNHSNIIYLLYQNKKRGFRMHKGRTHTVIDL